LRLIDVAVPKWVDGMPQGKEKAKRKAPHFCGAFRSIQDHRDVREVLAFADAKDFLVIEYVLYGAFAWPDLHIIAEDLLKEFILSL